MITNKHIIDENPGQFRGNEAYIQRLMAIIASFMSFSAIFAVMVWWMVQKRQKRFQFRHLLIWSLLGFDLIKAVAMVIFPLNKLNDEYHTDKARHSRLCDVVGYITSLAIEGGDLSVLFLAVHTALLVFWSESKGGLSQYKYAIFLAMVFIPNIMASLGLIPPSRADQTGYIDFTTHCDLRPYPHWYRLALSWIPRLVIILSICCIYFAIYIHIKVKINELERSLGSISSSTEANQETRPRETSASTIQSGELSHVACIKRWISQFPGLAFLYPYDWRSATVTVISTEEGTIAEATINTFVFPLDMSGYEQNAANLQNFINSENFLHFQRRRSAIERQVNFLFIYPLVYIFLWIFPLAQEALQYNDDQEGQHSVFWVAAVADFVKPFSGFIDSFVFTFKEFHSNVPYNEGPSTSVDPSTPQFAYLSNDQQQNNRRSTTSSTSTEAPRNNLWTYKLRPRRRSSSSNRSPKVPPIVDVISPLKRSSAQTASTTNSSNPTEQIDLVDFLRATQVS